MRFVAETSSRVPGGALSLTAMVAVIRQGIVMAALAAVAVVVAPSGAEAQYYGLTNVAEGRPVAPATGNFIGIPQYVTDGKADTYWYSHYTQEYTIDLGRQIQVGKIVVFALQASGVVISSSVDGAAFTPRHGFDATDAQHGNWVGALVSGPLVFAVDGGYSARYLKYRSVNLGCGCYQGTAEFSVYEWVATPPATLSGANLAALSGVTATNVPPFTSAAGFPPSNVVDGDLGTEWRGAYAGWYTGMAGQQLGYVYGRAAIDLGTELLVHGVRVRRPASGGAQTISVSLYDAAYQEIAWFGEGDPAVVGTANPAFGDAEFVLDTPIQARFVRVYQINPLVRSLAMQPALSELEVYGAADQADTTPPEVMGVPVHISAEATGPAGAIVGWPTPTAVDDVDGVVSVTCQPAAGTLFGIATTSVTCSASDASGNTSWASFSVTVSDTTPPMLVVPADVTVPATSLAGAAVSYTASAADIVDGPLTPICDPASGSSFPIGVTTVACTAVDRAGNSQTATFTVTVIGVSGQLALLDELLASLNLPAGLASSFGAKVRSAQAAVTRGDIAAACGQLAAFAHQAHAQAGKALTPAQAAQLQDAAGRIRQALGC